MILCSVSIQVSSDLVSHTNRISQQICIAPFILAPLTKFPFFLIGICIRHRDTNPLDKLKMIDTESKMETAPGGGEKEESFCVLQLCEETVSTFISTKVKAYNHLEGMMQSASGTSTALSIGINLLQKTFMTLIIHKI